MSNSAALYSSQYSHVNCRVQPQSALLRIASAYHGVRAHTALGPRAVVAAAAVYRCAHLSQSMGGSGRSVALWPCPSLGRARRPAVLQGLVVDVASVGPPGPRRREVTTQRTRLEMPHVRCGCIASDPKAADYTAICRAGLSSDTRQLPTAATADGPGESSTTDPRHLVAPRLEYAAH